MSVQYRYRETLYRVVVAKPGSRSFTVVSRVCPEFLGSFTFGRVAMKNFAQKIERFLKSEDGPTAVEYAVMLALIVVVCLGAIQTVGTNAKTTFNNVSAQL